MNPAANGKPRHAPFAQATAERCAEESHRLPPPPDARPWGEAYAQLISAEQSALIDAITENALAPAMEVLMEHIEARFVQFEERMLALLALSTRLAGPPQRPGDGHLNLDQPAERDTRRPQPRRPDSPPVEPPQIPEDDPDQTDPGGAQTPPDADDPAGKSR